MSNRNTESHFAVNPTNIDLSRSRFDMSYTVKTTFNVGDLIPIGRPIEVLPGDTFSIDTSKVVRLQTLITPMMDNLYLDVYWFFVPNRIIWNHWKEFMGENTSSAWLPSTTYSIPLINSGSYGWEVGSIADYMGVPVNISNLDISALPFRGYAKICDDWFRSENLSPPLNIPVGDATITMNNNIGGINAPAYGAAPYKVCKYFDYFTACLPAPQKGPDVNIPLGTSAPVFAGASAHSHQSDPLKVKIGSNSGATVNLVAASSSGGTISGGNSTSNALLPVNLYADLSSQAGTTINALRLAFQIQKLYEKDARGGTRYIEILKSHFGVTSPDSRLQRPEYLGGNRIPIHVNQIVNQSDTGLGNVGGQSLTTDVHSDFTHSFTEHGYIYCLAVARYDHTYQQGLHRMWSRRNRLDFYWPVLANIGEQAVKTKEIFCTTGTGSTVALDSVFGYQEAWAEYRYQPSIVTGEMRSVSQTSLDSWHLADDYQTAPTLSDAWIREDKTNVDRVLAVTSVNSNQLFGDFFIKCKATRCMPVYSIPGLIDHH